MREVLELARQLDEADLGALTVSLSRRVLVLALENESPGERQQKETLGGLLGSKRSQALSLALTDRCCRPHSPQRKVSAVIEVAKRVGIDPQMPLLDRVELRALVAFGSSIPKLTSDALAARLAHEASPFVLPAESDPLTRALLRVRTGGRRVNLNYLGEEVLGEADAGRRVATYLELLKRTDVDALSVKLSSVYSQMNLLAPEVVRRAVIRRLEPVLRSAQERGVLIYFDMEAFRDLEITVLVIESLCQSADFLQLQIGVALQAYLPDSALYLRRLARLADERVGRGGVPLKIRLVKGANLATEAVEASQHRLALPIFRTKAEVDANFKRLLRELLRPAHLGRLRVGLGSHNLFDQCYGLLLAEQRVTSSMLDLEMLEGMAGATGRVLTRLAGGALLYVPTVARENFPAAVSYLVRRLDENTGPENFRQASTSMEPGDASFNREAQGFLAAVESSYVPVAATFRTQDRSRPPPLPRRCSERRFDNCADTDWTRPQNRSALARALAQAEGSQCEIASILAGEEVRSGNISRGRDPSRPGVTAYRLHLASQQDTERALALGTSVAPRLAALPQSVRVLMVDRVADELEKSRMQLVALMVLDAGKRPVEADLEVSEAIDFARYYADSFQRRSEEYELTPRGLTLVASPFNFPLAIPLGGCLAALVAGNPVIVKPAPETPLVCWAAMRCLFRAGVPTDAVSLLLCDDATAGGVTRDPRVKTLVLTGGSETAKAIKRARPDLHLIAETGGKNGIFVSALSDRESALAAVISSAFGHAGQKCSAASLLVLEDEVFTDRGFRETLVDASQSLPVGSAWDAESFVTPLIREPEGALQRILETREKDLAGGSVLLAPRRDRENPQLISPTILWDIAEGSFAHQTEFFGPVLSVLRADSLSRGLALLNGTPYGLTAGFFGLSETEQEQFCSGIAAGNVYLNRSITGAVVGRQPFGGWKESCFGPGAKAGGPDYVLQFCRVQSPPEVRQVGDALLPRRGTPALGEENLLRTLPDKTWIVITDGASEEEVELARSARTQAGAPCLEVNLRTARTSDYEALDLPGARRVRVIGEVPQGLYRVAAERGWTLLTGPVCRDLGWEARSFTKQQSLSISYHRHGNVTLASIHPLLKGLETDEGRSI